MPKLWDVSEEEIRRSNLARTSLLRTLRWIDYDKQPFVMAKKSEAKIFVFRNFFASDTSALNLRLHRSISALQSSFLDFLRLQLSFRSARATQPICDFRRSISGHNFELDRLLELWDTLSNAVGDQREVSELPMLRNSGESHYVLPFGPTPLR